MTDPESSPIPKQDVEELWSNLISDFGPLLALFGEQVARQFLSGSMGWADNIIFAMAPLGIITAIVAAIRVAGPRWLKAIIGRARENRAIAEVELMSSTSHEVCELWNGQQLVRIMGSPPIWELLQISGNYEKHTYGLFTLEKAVKKGFLVKDGQRFYQQWLGQTGKGSSRRKSRTAEHFGDEESPSRMPVHDTKSPASTAPNISLNVHNRVGRRDLHFAASVGTVLQLGVLAYASFAAEHPGLKSRLGVVSEVDRAFGLTIGGTLALVAGLLICSFIIEDSTKEEKHLAKTTEEVHILWLQRAAAVNDQIFDSYAIFSKGPRHLITTSRRNLQQDSSFYENLTVLGACISVVGFVLQFAGLRGMHWSVSVTQLGATFLMTAVRAWVRRGLAKAPYAQQLPPEHEIDWLATRTAEETNLAVLWGKPDHMTRSSKRYIWSGLRLRPPQIPIQQAPRGFWTQQCFDWKILSGVDIDGYEPLQAYSLEGGLVGTKLRAQKVMEARKRLGALTQWPASASSSVRAIAVASAIEVVMNTPGIFETDKNVLVWSMNSTREQVIRFRLERKGNGRKWEADVAEIEAALSLWLFAVREGELRNFGDNDHKSENGDSRGNKSNDDDCDDRGAWLRAAMVSSEQAIRLLGAGTVLSQRDMERWLGDGLGGVIKIKNKVLDGYVLDTTDTIELGGYRTVGFGGRKMEYGAYKIGQVSADGSGYVLNEEQDITPEFTYETGSETKFCLATISEAPLDLLYAQDMFTAFMWAFAQSPHGKRINGQTTVKHMDNPTGNSDGSGWQSPALQNSTLSKLAQSIQRTGLGSLEEVYMSLIPPLSSLKRLPDVSAVVELVHERTKNDELDGKWDEVAKQYLWVFRTCTRRTFDPDERAAIQAAAALTELLRTLSITAELYEKLQYKDSVHRARELEALRSELAWELTNYCDESVLRTLAELYRIQDRTEGYESWCPLPIGTELKLEHNSSFGHTKLHLAVLLGQYSNLIAASELTKDVNKKDILGRTPLHYAASKGELAVMIDLLKYGADWKSQDFGEWTPLHYAAASPALQPNWLPLQDRVVLNMQGRDGLTPLHCAARSKNLHMTKFLIDFGADLRMHDNSRRTPLHWASYYGSSSASAVNLMLRNRASVGALDDFGRTPLHLAVIGGCEKAVIAILQAGAELNAKDRDLRTAVQMAALNGDKRLVVMLLARGADTNAEALHVAAAHGDENAVSVLLERGSDVNAMEGPYGSALQAAAANGYEKIANLLLEHGADINARGGRHGCILQAAASNGCENVVHLLLAKGVDVNAQCGPHGSALQAAAVNRHENVVRALLEGGADANTKVPKHGNVLQTAAADGNIPVIKILLEKGAQVNVQGGQYGNALQAAAAGGHDKVMRILLETGADPHAQGGKYGNALQAAAARGDVGQVKILLEKGSDVNVQGGEYGNALQAAAWSGSLDLTKILLEKGAEINAQGGRYGNALQAAAVSGNREIVRMLLKGGADINAQGGKYGNALQAATRGETMKFVEDLLGEGVDNSGDSEHENVLKAAVGQVRAEIVRLLLESGARTDIPKTRLLSRPDPPNSSAVDYLPRC